MPNDAISPSVVLNPRMALLAKSRKAGKAYLAWTIARHLDPAGSGVIARTELEREAVELGFSKRQWRKMVAEALEHSLFTKQEWRHGGEQAIWYQLTSSYRAAEILGMESASGRKAEINVEHLAGDDCWAYIWSGYLTTLKGRHTSRSYMRSQTGIKEKTQQRYEDKVRGIKRIKAYGISRKSASYLTSYREFGSRNTFTVKDHRTGNVVIARRLPDARMVRVQGVQLHERKRTSTKSSKSETSIACRTVESGRRGESHKLFHMSIKSRKHIESCVRRMQGLDRSADLPRQIFAVIPRGTFYKPHRNVRLFDIIDLVKEQP